MSRIRSFALKIILIHLNQPYLLMLNQLDNTKLITIPNIDWQTFALSNINPPKNRYSSLLHHIC